MGMEIIKNKKMLTEKSSLVQVNFFCLNVIYNKKDKFENTIELMT